jgi:hypothetical protein
MGAPAKDPWGSYQARRLEEGAAALEEEEQAQRLALAEISQQEEEG